MTVAMAVLSITRSRQAAGLPTEWAEVLWWQGLSYAAWIPVGMIAWRLLRRRGLGRQSGQLIVGLGAVSVVLHAAMAAALQDRYSNIENSSFDSLMIARMPIDLLIFIAIVTALWAALAHRHSLSIQRALATARAASESTLRSGAHGHSATLVFVATGTGNAPVSLASIEWVGAAGNYVVINWDGREGLVRGTLKRFGAKLDPDVFVRAHRSTIVNLARVANASSLADGSWRLVMESGAELVASRTYRDQILTRLGRRQ